MIYKNYILKQTTGGYDVFTLKGDRLGFFRELKIAKDYIDSVIKEHSRRLKKENIHSVGTGGKRLHGQKALMNPKKKKLSGEELALALTKGKYPKSLIDSLKEPVTTEKEEKEWRDMWDGKIEKNPKRKTIRNPKVSEFIKGGPVHPELVPLFGPGEVPDKKIHMYKAKDKATAKSIRRKLSKKYPKRTFIVENPSSRQVEIYSSIKEIIAVKGAGHKCDAACRRAHHTYRHTFKPGSRVLGNPDGSLTIR